MITGRRVLGDGVRIFFFLQKAEYSFGYIKENKIGKNNLMKKNVFSNLDIIKKCDITESIQDY